MQAKAKKSGDHSGGFRSSGRKNFRDRYTTTTATQLRTSKKTLQRFQIVFGKTGETKNPQSINRKKVHSIRTPIVHTETVAVKVEPQQRYTQNLLEHWQRNRRQFFRKRTFGG